MTRNEDYIRATYRTAEGDVLDLDGWRDAFTEDGVFTNMAGESFSGPTLPMAVSRMAEFFPDVHRELVRVNDMGGVVACEVVIQGTHLGAMPTPAGLLQPTGARINVPTADFFYLRDGKIERFNCYITRNIMFAQLGIFPNFAAVVEKTAAAN
jgi:ketosteroid isomerase-like protein